jgi:hypothetical protein
MNVMTLIIVIVSLSAYAALIAFLPLRKARMLKKAGNYELPVKPRLLKFAIVVLVCCPLLILLILLRDMGVMTNCIMCAVSLLGTEMAVREVLTAKCSGVYTNGLISDGHFIAFSEIFGIPFFSLTDEQQELHDTGVLDLVTKRKTNLQIIYSTEKEFRRVIEKILELEPRFQQ